MHNPLIHMLSILALIGSADSVCAQLWERVGKLGGNTFYGGTVSPYGDIYVVSQGMHRSSDDGKVWRRTTPGLPASFKNLTSDIVWVHDTIFVTTSGSLWRSRDMGNTWDSIITVSNDTKISYGQSGVLAFSHSYLGAVSTDGGVSWLTMNGPSKLHSKVANIHVDGNGSIYAMTSGGVHKSLNLGIDWTDVTGLPGYKIVSSFCSPHNSCTIVSLNDSLWRTLDNGNTWEQIYKAESAVFSIISLGRDTVCLLTSAGVIHRSTNSGATWSVYSTRFENSEYKLRLFGRHNNLFVLFDDSLFKHDMVASADSWEQIIVPNATVRGLVATPSGFIHGLMDNAITPTYARMISFDGERWIEKGTMPASTPFAVDSTGAICAVFDKALQRSTNNGASWTTSEAISSFNTTFKIATTKQAIVLASRYGVYRSTDNGASFTIENTGLAGSKESIENVVATDSVIYIGGTMKFFRSTDGGSTWQEPLFPFIIGSGSMRAMSCAGSNIVLGIDQTGVYFSNDYGIFWENNSQGLPGGIIHDLELTPSGAVFAVTDNGIYEYAPASKRWSNANDGIIIDHVTSIALGADGKIYAATNSDGVWRTTKSYGTWTSDVAPLPSSEQVVSIYPNPASTQLHVDLGSSFPGDFTISIYDVLGVCRLVSTGEQTLNVSSLSNGQYILSFFSEGKNKTLPFVVQR